MSAITKECRIFIYSAQFHGFSNQLSVFLDKQGYEATAFKSIDDLRRSVRTVEREGRPYRLIFQEGDQYTVEQLKADVDVDAPQIFAIVDKFERSSMLNRKGYEARAQEAKNFDFAMIADVLPNRGRT